MTFGSWILPAFRLLAKGKSLRGTALDPFGYSAERQAERQLIVGYEEQIGSIIDDFANTNEDKAIAIASLPDDIRGFGHVKLASIEATRAKKATLETELYGSGEGTTQLQTIEVSQA